MSSPEPLGLARSTVAGTAWNYSAFVLGKALVFLSTILLARLLAPQDFGLVALGMLVLAFLETLSDLGVGQALIYRVEDPERTGSVAFAINVVVGVGLTAVALLVAPLAADFFHEPRLTPVLRVLAVSFLLSALRNVHQSRLKKELEFRRRFIPEISRTVAKGATSVLLAWLGFGVWSLVWGQIAGGVTSTLLYWWAARWRPRLVLDRTIARALLGYGGQILLLKILAAFLSNVDYLIIGRRLDAIALGFYVMAFRIPELVIVSLCNVVSQALFPAYAKLQTDMAALRRGYLTTLRYVALITVPLGVGLSLVAPDFVHLVYTSRWAPSIPVMQVLALYSMFLSLGFNAGDVYKAIGRPSILTSLGALRLLVAVPVLWLAADHGILAVGIGQAAIALVFTLLGIGVTCRVLATPWRDVAAALRPAFRATAVMALGTLGLQRVLPSPARLTALVLVGATVYALTLWLAERQTVDQAITLLRRSRRAPDPEPDESSDPDVRS